MVGIAALVALLVLFAYPPLVPLVMVATVSLFLWRSRAATLDTDRLSARARDQEDRARAEERRERELIQALRSLP